MKKNKMITYIFNIAYFLFLTYSFIGHSTIFGNYLKQLTNLALCMFVFVIVLQFKTYTSKDIIKSVLLIILGGIIAYTTKSYNLIKLAIFIVAMKNIKFEDCLKFDLKIRLVLIFATVIFCKFGILPDVLSYEGGGYKHSYGFTNPNVTGFHILIAVFEYIYLGNKNNQVFKSIIGIIIMIITEHFTGCRTTTLIMIIASLLFIINKYNNKFIYNKFVSFFIKNSYIIFTIIVFLFFALYKNNSQLGYIFNYILSGRLGNIDIYSQQFNILLLGNNINETVITLDTFYAYVIYMYGIISFIFYTVFFRSIFNYLYMNKNYKMICILFSFMIYGLSEKLWTLADYNAFILIYSYVFYNSEKFKIKPIKISVK